MQDTEYMKPCRIRAKTIYRYWLQKILYLWQLFSIFVKINKFRDRPQNFFNIVLFIFQNPFDRNTASHGHEIYISVIILAKNTNFACLKNISFWCVSVNVITRMFNGIWKIKLNSIYFVNQKYKYVCNI